MNKSQQGALRRIVNSGDVVAKGEATIKATKGSTIIACPCPSWLKNGLVSIQSAEGRVAPGVCDL